MTINTGPEVRKSKIRTYRLAFVAVVKIEDLGPGVVADDVDDGAIVERSHVEHVAIGRGRRQRVVDGSARRHVRNVKDPCEGVGCVNRRPVHQTEVGERPFRYRRTHCNVTHDTAT